MVEVLEHINIELPEAGHCTTDADDRINSSPGNVKLTTKRYDNVLVGIRKIRTESSKAQALKVQAPSPQRTK